MIYIVTHKETDLPTGYTPLLVGEAEADIDLKVRDYYPELSKMNQWYGECEAMRWIADNDTDDYCGQMTYRRQFEVPSDIKDYDGAAPTIMVGEVRNQYALCHYGYQMDLVTDIISTKYQWFLPTWKKTLSSNVLRPYGTFILRNDLYKEYVEFLYGILDEVRERLGLTDMDAVRRHIESQREPAKVSVEYQCRFGGFLAERIFTAFASNLNMRELDVRFV